MAKAWRKATKAAKLEGLLFHDMRRSAVHNLMDNGEQEQVVMSISGHKTRSVFERYNIISNKQAHEAMRRREEATRKAAAVAASDNNCTTTAFSVKAISSKTQGQ